MKRVLTAAAIMVVCSMGGAQAAAPAPGEASAAPAAVKQLMQKSLSGTRGKEALMLTVDYVPGGASLPHRHNAQVFVYVLEGTVKMQVAGAEPVTLGPGGTFYEGPEDVHSVSANASSTEPARLLVFIVKDAAAPVSVAVPAAAKP
jgi:quercetin dioxygenase-like cupin family protein